MIGDLGLMFALPTSIVADILSGWLLLAEVIRVDSACCKHSVRKSYLEVICSTECSLAERPHTESQRLCDGLLQWASCRRVVLREVVLRWYTSAEIAENYFENCARGISKIIICNNKAPSILACPTYCANLTSLQLDQCEVTTPSLRDIFVQCQKLRSFSFEYHKKRSLPNYDELCSELADLACPNLQVVYVGVRSNVGLLRSIVKLAVNVEVLVLSLGMPSTLDVDSIVNAVSPSATTLSLSSVDISSRAFARVVCRCPNLVHLRPGTEHLHASAIQSLATLRNLRSIDLSGMYSVDVDVLTALADACGNRLTELLLCYCYNLDVESVQKILPRFTQLTSFGMHYQEEDRAVVDLSLLSRFTTLALVFSGYNESELVAQLAQHCPNLQCLYLQIYLLNFRDMDVLVESCTQLRVLCVAMDYGPPFESEDESRWLAAFLKNSSSHWFQTRVMIKVSEEDNLLALPSVIIADVLSGWIEVVDFKNLDSACCNHTLRKIYLDVAPECCINTLLVDDDNGDDDNDNDDDGGNFDICDDAIAWANLRKIQLQNITVSNCSNLNVYKNHMKLSGKSVTAARGRNAPERALICLQYCPNIVSVDLFECEIDSSLRVVFECLPKLREFRCDFNESEHSIRASDLDGLNCPTIKLIKLEQFLDASVPMAILKLAVSVETVLLTNLACDVESVVEALSPAITTLALQAFHISPGAFCRIPALCPNLVHLQLADSQPINYQDGGLTVAMMKALADFDQLRSVDLSCSGYVEDDVLPALADACGSQLTELLVAPNSYTNPVVQAAILPKFTNLKSVAVTDEGAKLDLSLLRDVTSLMLVLQNPLTMDYVNRVVQHCGNLQHLHLQLPQGLHREFPADGIDKLVRGLPCLQTFNFSQDCRGRFDEEEEAGEEEGDDEEVDREEEYEEDEIIFERWRVAGVVRKEKEDKEVERWRAVRPDVVFESNKKKRGLRVLQSYKASFSLCW